MNSDNVSSMFFNPEAIGLDRIFNALDKLFDCKSGFSVNLSNILSGSMKIVAYFCIYILYKNYDKMWRPCRSLILKLVYTRTVLAKDIEIDVVSKFKELCPIEQVTSVVGDSSGKNSNTPKPALGDSAGKTNELWVSGLPLYLEKEGNDNVIYNIPYFHNHLIEELHSFAQKRKENDGLSTVCRDENGKVFTPLEMFASDNYIKVDKITSCYFRTFKDTKMITPPIIMLNGEPGLGKTNVSHYLGSLKKYGEIRLIDLTSPSIVNKGFSSIIADLTSKDINIPSIICFDELDKYIVMYTQHIYTSKQQGVKKESTNMDEVVDNDFSTFERQVKLSVISTIGRLDSVKNYHQGVIWMFFANNIHTIFQGLRQTHIDSVKTRFTFIDFHKCGKEELARYVRQFNDRLTDPQQKYTDLRLKSAIRKIRHDIDVTYRDIQICMNKSAYDIDLLVKYINEGVKNPLFNYNEDGTEIIPSVSSPSSSNSNRSGGQEEEKNEVEKFEIEKRNIQRTRDKKKEKLEIVSDILEIIADTETVELGPLTDDEVINKMHELANGYNLVKLAELEITKYEDIFNIAQHSLYYRPKVFEHLLSVGVDPNLIVDRESILGTAFRSCENPTLSILLIKHGANLGKDYSALQNLFGKPEKVMVVIQYLIEEKGFDVNSEISIAGSYIHYCIRSTRSIGFLCSLIPKFIEIGFDVNSRNSAGNTIFQIFAEKLFRTGEGKHLLINTLLDNGAETKLYLSGGRSILFEMITTEALDKENKEIIIRKMISMGGADIPLNKDKEVKISDPIFKSVPSEIMDLIPLSAFSG
jgi:hypothetical protein